MLEASLEVRQPTITVSRRDGVAGENQDVEMLDAPAEGQIIVRNLNEDADAEGEPDMQSAVDGDTGTDADADAEGEIDDQMMLDTPQAAVDGAEQCLTPAPTKASRPVVPLRLRPPSLEKVPTAKPREQARQQSKGLLSSPPALNGYGAALHPAHSGPLTPPQSNGSLGRGQTDVLSEGGLPWYLKGFELKGTTAVEEQWAGRDAVRSLSEELTDMDEEALKDLEFDVDDETITASPVNDTSAASSAKKRTSPTKFRKGVRSSARRR